LETRSEGDDKPVPLASRGDFRLGEATIRPATLTVEGPETTAVAEPRVMQVLLALADANGAVLSRDDLLRICWGGRIVGDDAINRAIAEARRLGRITGASFEIETVTKVGYRLKRDDETGVPTSPNGQAKVSKSPNRRKFLGWAAAGVLVAGSAGYGLLRFRSRQQARGLIERARQIEAMDGRDAFEQAGSLYRRAISVEPDNAEAWGRLSLAQTVIAGENRRGVMDTTAAVSNAEKALSLDPNEPSARTALAVVKRGLDDWETFERELTAVLAADPANLVCLDYMTQFLQGVGRCLESRRFCEHGLRIEPFAPAFQFKRAFKYWIFGRPAEAERVSRSAFELWPQNPQVWNARLTVLAFTGRAEAALKMLQEDTNRPDIGPPAIEMWSAGLRAILTHSRVDIALVKEIAARMAIQAPGIGANAVMLLSHMGEVDAAYQVIEGFVLRRGRTASLAADRVTPSWYADSGWRHTQWLFTPATLALRQDARFTAFCDDLGYSDYWRERGIWPDEFIRGSLVPR
jgi:DNA-binding winged helix-turn-helix (wHTH) protein/Tfp pilus assembly protein PilF